MNTTVLKSVFAVVATLAIVNVVPYIEGRLLPVVTSAHVTTVSPTKEYGWVEIYGELDKLRDCSFVDLEFMYETALGKAVTVQHRFAEPSAVRPAGNFNFGPWLIQVTPDQLRSEANVYAYAVHDCHGLYHTKTLMPLIVD